MNPVVEGCLPYRSGGRERVKKEMGREGKEKRVLSGKSVKRGHLGKAVENSAFTLYYNTDVYK